MSSAIDTRGFRKPTNPNYFTHVSEPLGRRTKMRIFYGLLFFLLVPGVLLTIPAGSRGFFMSGQMSLASAAFHAVVFLIVGGALRPLLFTPCSCGCCA